MFALTLLVMLLASGCESAAPVQKPTEEQALSANASTDHSSSMEADASTLKLNDALIPMGESDGVFYEIFVRSFYDTNGDGIGDLNGVTAKLDYLEELGIQHIWLMPINPSPSYHGYDVTDYYDIHPDYGTLEDFKLLLAEAHKRDMKIILDLVVNHTSIEHPWFKEAMSDENSPKRDWYMWAEELGLDSGTRGAWGQQAWHELQGRHYLGIFWEGMPDLHMDQPEVRAEIKHVAEFWLKLGVDGFRLDAAKHVYEDFQNTSQDPKVVSSNQAWWQEFRTAVHEVNKSAYLIGEVWDSPAVIGPFLNQGLDSAFNFDMSKRLISMAKDERDADIGAMISRIYSFYSKQSNGQFVDAPFLTNHDENRVMSELEGHIEHAKMAASLLLTLPGNPFIYYGEEIGMQGMKPDERIREPMIWTTERRSQGMTFSVEALSNPDTISVEAQMKDPNSLWTHYKKLLQYRQSDAILQEGGIQSYVTGVPEVAAFIRATADEARLVLHNLSSHPQQVKLEDAAAHSLHTLSFATADGAAISNGVVQLPPYSTIVLSP